MIADEVRAELDSLAVTSVSPGMAAVAVKLAEALDALESGDAPTSQAVVADKLATIMTRLRAVAPVKTEEGDVVDAVGRKREERRARLRAAQEASSDS
ncbi:hypothetical protein ACF1BR_32490 [Streptomyces rubiginosohelvolus]|uniref:hypothetical protein n=1 Tax=Streptomyces rubiginosohelvolus TaxID=67362 RepID=UPI0036F6DDD0